MNTAKYGKFRGVDLSTDPAVIDESRSPYAPNLISDEGGYPEKRIGWRTLFELTDKINGLHRVVISGTEHLLVHAGTTIYRYDEDGLTDGVPTSKLTSVSNSRSTSFVCGGKLYILTGAQYLVYDGTLTEVSGYVPTTLIGADYTGAGTAHEAVNLIQTQRKNKFAGDGTHTEFKLDGADIDSVDTVKVDGTETTEYTANKTSGTVTFTNAPGAPSVTGEDNVEITFTKAITGYADKIKKCRFAGLYGFGGNEGERVFFSGNPDSPNVDWHCEISAPDYQVDPTYIPDTSFDYIGADENPIMGYVRYGEYQAIIKGENAQDASIFFRSVGLDESGNVYFSVAQGVTGVGAVSQNAFAYLGDEPLFLSSRGIHGIAAISNTDRNTVQNRSHFVDSELCKEELSTAVAVEWDNRYLLATSSGNAYVLDGKQNKSYVPSSGGNYVYECYTWTNIPAICFLSTGSVLYFGTSDGKICRFNTDISRMTRFSDDGAAIMAAWSTKTDDDGDIGRYKSMPYCGTSVMIKPYTRSSVKFSILTDQDHGAKRDIASARMNIFNFNDIDFSNFSFETGGSPRTFPLNAKVRRYITIQIIAANNTVNEGFGVYGIVRRWRWNRFVR